MLFTIATEATSPFSSTTSSMIPVCSRRASIALQGRHGGMVRVITDGGVTAVSVAV